MADQTEFEATVYISGVHNSERKVIVKSRAGDDRKSVWVPDTIAQFRTGNKIHTYHHTIAVLQKDGRYAVHRTATIHNRHAYITGWKDEPTDSNSGWTG